MIKLKIINNCCWNWYTLVKTSLDEAIDFLIANTPYQRWEHHKTSAVYKWINDEYELYEIYQPPLK